jgi:hypothetical protein
MVSGIFSSLHKDRQSGLASDALENLEVTEQRQQCDDRQDDQATLKQIFQEMLPEKTDDHKHYNDTYNGQQQPDNLT